MLEISRIVTWKRSVSALLILSFLVLYNWPSCKTCHSPESLGQTNVVFQNANSTNIEVENENTTTEEVDYEEFNQEKYRYNTSASTEDVNEAVVIPGISNYSNWVTQCDPWKKNSSSSKDVRNMFTVVILSYKRNLDGKLQLFKDMPLLHKIIIVKNSNETTFNSTTLQDLHVPVTVIEAKENTLNNRYIPYKEIETDAVLNLDDDFSSLQQSVVLGTFFIWRDQQDAAVGLLERSHEKIDNEWTYIVNPQRREHPRYSLLLGSYIFAHKKYYEAYTKFMDKRVRDFVTENKNCEDLAIDFLISKLSGKPALLAKFSNFNKFDYGDFKKGGGLSNRKSHFDQRSHCIANYIDIFGDDALLYNEKIATYDFDICKVIYGEYIKTAI